MFDFADAVSRWVRCTDGTDLLETAESRRRKIEVAAYGMAGVADTAEVPAWRRTPPCRRRWP